MMILPISQELRCILWLGICMMTLYAADYTLINLQVSKLVFKETDYMSERYLRDKENKHSFESVCNKKTLS